MKGYEKAAQAIQSVKQVIIGKDDCVLAIMEAILANGHILIEDIPGVGKTSMALAFARVLDMKQSRVQFTPDVLPTDITGFPSTGRSLAGLTMRRALSCAICFWPMR